MSSENTSGSNSSAVTSPAERRRNLRFPFTANVEATEAKSGMNILGRACDLGLGGCYIDTLNPLPVDSVATLRITKENETFEVQGKVVSSQIGLGMGVAFVSAQPSHVRILQKWILEISGKSTLPPDAGAAPASPAEQLRWLHDEAFSELVEMLMKKDVLTEAEGKELLRKLLL